MLYRSDMAFDEHQKCSFEVTECKDNKVSTQCKSILKAVIYSPDSDFLTFTENLVWYTESVITLNAELIILAILTFT